jgi:TRAP-type C4-dicarboxylate transport system permease small subunit
MSFDIRDKERAGADSGVAESTALSAPARRSQNVVTRAVRGMSSALAFVAGLGIVGLMLLTVADVALRKFAGRGIPGTLEISEVALVAVVFAALMAAEVNNVHVRTPILVERLSDRVANLAKLLGLVPATLFVSWAAWLTAVEGLASTERGEFRFGIVAVPVWPAKLVIPIGLAGLAVALMAKVVTAVRRARLGLPPETSGYDNPL